MSTAVGALAAMVSTYFIAAFAIYVIWVIANWRIFQKAGEPGWKSIIPVYNVYTLFKFTWSTAMFWIMILLSIGAAFLSARTGNSNSMHLLSNLLTLAMAIINLVASHKLSKAFGHGIGFTLGLIFLNPIFSIILGFGASEYQGPQ